MCGRFAFNFTWTEIHALLGLTTDLSEEPRFMAPRFNAAPTQMLPVAVERDGERVLESMQWGLVPSWAKDRSIGSRLINARSETVHEKPAFREAFRHRRCLVPASGFYEWKRASAQGGPKQPYFIHLRSGEGFAMAGLWERSGPLISFTVLTTRANALVAPVHDRMPVIVPPASYGRWLGEGDSSKLGDLLVPLEAELMAAHPVSRRVGSPANDDPALMDPIEPEARERTGDGETESRQTGLFGGI